MNTSECGSCGSLRERQCDDMKMVDLPEMIPIKKIIVEAQGIKSFVFEHHLGAKPGQFVMLWLPGFDMKPMSVAFDDGEQFTVVISAVGPFSQKMCSMKEGELVGMMGPFGTYFSMDGKNVALIGGGYGTAPLAFLAEERKKEGKGSHLIVGARTADLLLFRGWVKDKCLTASYSTNDGSFGFKGFNTELFEELLKKEKFDYVMTCGPELMMKKVLDICVERGISCEVSIERYMKCGIGICGTCCVDPLGIRMCTEGPIVSGEVAQKVTEFGKYHRDRFGIGKEF